MIEPWECSSEPGEPEICKNGLGRYIIVFHSWVEDPEALAREQVEKYDGELGFIYKYALKGYSAGYSKSAIAAVRQEPTVKYAEADGIVTIAGTSSAASGSECDSGGGPEPPLPPKEDPPSEPTPPDEPICMIPEGCDDGPGDGPVCMIPEGCDAPPGSLGGAPTGVVGGLAAGSDGPGSPTVTVSERGACGQGKALKDGACVRKATSARRACGKASRAAKRRCLRRLNRTS